MLVINFIPWIETLIFVCNTDNADTCDQISVAMPSDTKIIQLLTVSNSAFPNN